RLLCQQHALAAGNRSGIRCLPLIMPGNRLLMPSLYILQKIRLSGENDIFVLRILYIWLNSVVYGYIMTLRSLILLSVSTAAIVCAQGAQAATNLLVNGGFDSIGAGASPEGWGGLTYYTDGTHPGNVALPGWTVEAGSVDL